MKIILIFLTLCLFSVNSFAYDLTVNITNINSAFGTIKIAVYPPNAGFPREYENTIATAIVDFQGSSASYTFLNLPENNYAVAVFHDINSNDDLDTNRLGIPIEPFGFSNNPRLFGPPTFRRCNFRLNKDLNLIIMLKRLL